MNAFTNGGAKTIGYNVNGGRKTYNTNTYTLGTGNNQLVSFKIGTTTTTVTSDPNGNITGFSPAYGTPAVTTLAYNNANRLISVSGSGGTLGSYIYDGSGQRFSKTVGTTTTLYQYSGGALLAETTGGVETNYIYLNGRPLAILTGTTFSWLHDDNVGRPQVATNASQAVVWKASYLPFGETLAASGTATVNLRFPGQYYDAESGFSHNGFRDYAPSLGRYLEADPLGIYDNAGFINAGMNPYNYVGADPMRSIDPQGLADNQGLREECAKNPTWAKTVGKWICDNLDGVGAQILVVTYPNGTKCSPYSKVKNKAQEKAFGLPKGTPVPIVVPSGIDPQGDVNYFASGWTSLGDASTFGTWWLLPDQQYKNNYGPNSAMYDAYGNFEYGATGRAAGFDLISLQFAGGPAYHVLHHYLAGGPVSQDPQNIVDIAAGFNAISNSGALSVEDDPAQTCK
jgi:RHS repeat-associated protein